MKRGRRFIQLILIGVIFVSPSSVWAQVSSPNYRLEEIYLGTGGDLDSSSTNYRAKQSAGDAVVGNTTSPNYQAQGGFNTDRHESLEFVVNGSNIDLGVLSSSTTTTATSTFSVKAYLAHGYVVQVVSDPPKNNAYTMNALSTPTASSAGTEQFGINLVDNSSPNIGANPSQAPDSTFGFGAAEPGYNTANLFKYVKNDIVARSTKSSGTTNYTISYIFNTSTVTPGGTYTFRQDLVATATY